MKTIANNAPYDIRVETINLPGKEIGNNKTLSPGSGDIKLKELNNEFWIIVSFSPEHSASFSIKMPYKIKRVVPNPSLPPQSSLPSDDVKIAYLISKSASLNDSDDEHGHEDMEVDDENEVPLV